MQAPTGRSGVQALPKSLQSGGVLIPLSTAPHWQAAGSGTSRRSSPKRSTASRCANAGRSARPLPGIVPMPRQCASHGSKKRSSTSRARGLPSGRTTLVYWISTAGRPAASCASSIAVPARMSTASKPVTTAALPKRSGRKAYGAVPVTVQTCPGRMKPSTSTSPEPSSAASAGGTVLCTERIEKFGIPSRSASASVPATSGEVVSNPVAKKTTSREGSLRASASASSGE